MPQKNEYAIGRRWHDLVIGLNWGCLGIIVCTLITCCAKFLTMYIVSMPLKPALSSTAEFFRQPEGWKNKKNKTIYINQTLSEIKQGTT